MNLLLYTTLILLISIFRYFNIINDYFTLIFLFTSSILFLYKYWRKQDWYNAKYDSFGSALVLITLFFRLIYLFDTIIYGTRFDIWPETVQINKPIIYYYIKSEVITILGLYILVSSWRYFSVKELKFSSFINAQIQEKNIFRFIYFFSLLIQFSVTVVELQLGALTQFFSIFYSMGIASVYMIARGSDLKVLKVNNLVLAFFLALPFSVLALKSGLKEQIFFPMIPLSILVWQYFKSIFSRLVIMTSFIFILAISQIYVTYIRYEGWLGNRSISFNQVINNAFDDLDSEQLFSYVDFIFSRLNLSASHSVTVALKERDGIIPSEIFGVIPANIIPRFIWPDKPIISPGSTHTKRILNIKNDEIISASAPGFFQELYFGGGLLGLILSSFLYGLIVGKIQIYIEKRVSIKAAAILSFMLFYLVLRFDESAVVYSFSNLFFIFISLIITFSLYNTIKKI